VLCCADRTSPLSQWLKEGKMKSIEHVTEGIENAADAFVAMLQGSSAVGKAVLKVADPE
jgi:NADPH-dependent curcumin reductase CurA